MDEEDEGMVSIYNIVGGLLSTQSLSSDASSVMLTFNELATGLYLIEIKINGQRKLSEQVSVIRP